MQFEKIINQSVLANRLTAVIDEGRISHAQLFLGNSSSGTLALAIAYMQYVCCQNRQHYTPDADGHWYKADGTAIALRADSCGTCPACRKIEALQHPDLHFIFPNIPTGDDSAKSASSENLLEQYRDFLIKYNQHGTLNQWFEEMRVENKQGIIRERDADNIVRYVNLQAYEAPYKLVLIWHAEKMNLAAANTLLKTIEEPTGRTLIIMTAESTERMLDTVISRVQQTNVPTFGGIENVSADFAPLFVAWMRLLFKLDMVKVSAWVDEMAKEGRERQKQFLLYCLEAMRVCLLRNVSGGTYRATMSFGDEKFDGSFYTVVTPNNIAAINDAINHTLMAIERNASPGLAFMSLSFKISSALRKK